MLTSLIGIIAASQKIVSGGSSAHRHWRIYTTKSVANGSYLGLGQVELRGISGGPDLTSSADAATKSSAGSAHSSFPASNAFNDNEGNDWLSLNGQGQQPNWVAWDFGAGNEQDIVEAALHPPGNLQSAPYDVSIQYSDDGINWITAWDEGVQSWTSATKIFTKPVPSAYTGKTVIFGIMGQSNSIGRAGPIDGVLDATDADILMYDDTGGTFVTAADPLDHFDELSNQIGYGLSFAKAFKTAEPSLVRVILVGMGKGGAGFVNGDWNVSNGSYYQPAKTRWNAAHGKAVTDYGAENVTVGGIIWTQGEDEIIDFPTYFDGTDDGKRYLAMPVNMFTAIRSVWAGMSDTTPIIFTSIPPGTALTGQAAAYSEITTTTAGVASVLPYSSYVDALDLTCIDDRHFDAASLRTLGNRISPKVADAVANDAVVYTYPTLVADAANVETALSFDFTGMPDQTPLKQNIVSAYPEFDNKRVFVKNGAMQFDQDAELRWRDNGKPRLSNRDFSIKIRLNSTSTIEQGIIGDYQTTENKRCFVLRVKSSAFQFYVSDNGTAATLALTSAYAINTWYDVEIRRIGTALSLRVDDTEVDTHTLASNFTFFDTGDTSPLLIGDHINDREFAGQMSSLSLEFLS